MNLEANVSDQPELSEAIEASKNATDYYTDNRSLTTNTSNHTMPYVQLLVCKKN